MTAPMGDVCYCGGRVVLAKDDVDCDHWRCTNYPTCDEAYYTAEQCDASLNAYYDRNPEAAARFLEVRGFPHGTKCTCDDGTCYRCATDKLQLNPKRAAVPGHIPGQPEKPTEEKR